MKDCFLIKLHVYSVVLDFKQNEENTNELWRNYNNVQSKANICIKTIIFIFHIFQDPVTHKTNDLITFIILPCVCIY